MTTGPERFDIAGDLLAGPDGDGRWNNLGYWENSQNYTEACHALAEYHGLAAGLTSSDRVLELACGYGAALDVWRDRFGVSQISALEYRPDCVRQISLVGHPSVESVVTARFDESLDCLFPDSFFDAVICVDAAYHATSLTAFIIAAESVLADQGVLVFSTVVLTNARQPGSWLRRWVGSALLAAAAIPASSLVTESILRERVAEQGLVVTAVENISGAVFSGFADWVERRSVGLGWRDKYSIAWLKIAITARCCRWLADGGTLRYMLVSVSRPQNR